MESNASKSYFSCTFSCSDEAGFLCSNSMAHLEQKYLKPGWCATICLFRRCFFQSVVIKHVTFEMSSRVGCCMMYEVLQVFVPKFAHSILYKVLYKYKKAFFLRDEIGLCQSMEIELELKDESPFFIRPFPIKESDKDIVDKEMRKGCLLGILKKGMSSYSSPIMLIPRKLSGIPRIVTDFRHLNSILVTLQTSIPLVRDAIQILGASGCEILSLADLRDAYHTLRLSERSKKFCGITPYYGSDSYLYQRLGMGLSVSPAIWQNFIQKVLQEIPDHRKNHLAIMDDCLVFSEKKTHLKHLTNLFKALIRNGLKISPRKCKLFKKKFSLHGTSSINHR